MASTTRLPTAPPSPSRCSEWPRASPPAGSSPAESCGGVVRFALVARPVRRCASRVTTPGRPTCRRPLRNRRGVPPYRLCQRSHTDLRTLSTERTSSSSLPSRSIRLAWRILRSLCSALNQKSFVRCTQPRNFIAGPEKDRSEATCRRVRRSSSSSSVERPEPMRKRRDKRVLPVSSCCAETCSSRSPIARFQSITVMGRRESRGSGDAVVEKNCAAWCQGIGATWSSAKV